jgi:regulator of protease activity HflC (stomatin/prohibitin superfamily)
LIRTSFELKAKVCPPPHAVIIVRAVLHAEKTPDSRYRVEAQGIADYQRIISTSLTDNQIKYEMIKAYKEMATSNNAKMIIMGDNKSPIILDGK